MSFKREVVLRYGKLTLSPIKKWNTRKSKTIVNLPSVQGRKKELETRLDQLPGQFPTAGDLEQLERNLDDVPVTGDGTPGASESNETFGAAAAYHDGGVQQMNTFDEEVGEPSATKKEKSRNTHVTATALHRRWCQDLLPTLQRPLLEFISMTTGHIMMPIVEGDLSPSGPQPGICTIKEGQVLCLSLTVRSTLSF
jgi:hypothetical protein